MSLKEKAAIGKDNLFFAGCDTQGIDQGQHSLYLVWWHFHPQINIYLFMILWKEHFILVVAVAKDTVDLFKQLFTNTDQLICVLSPKCSVSLVYYILIKIEVYA